MASAHSSADSWMQQWIDAQRALIDRWSTPPASQQPGQFVAEWDNWWRSIVPETEGPVADALQKMRAARDTYLSSIAATSRHSGMQPGIPPLEAEVSWQTLLNAPFASYAQWWSRVPALGLARESVEISQAITAAQAECERLATEVGQAFARIQTDALELLERRISERVHAAEPITTYRELYDLWIECGEQTYSRVARSEGFTALQARYGNAVVRLRREQQRLAEQALKQLDLPTRAELNGLHRRLRDVSDQLAKLQAEKTVQRTPAARRPKRKSAAKPVRRKRKS